jgi:hypothetical protein
MLDGHQGCLLHLHKVKKDGVWVKSFFDGCLNLQCSFKMMIIANNKSILKNIFDVNFIT